MNNPTTRTKRVPIANKETTRDGPNSAYREAENTSDSGRAILDMGRPADAVGKTALEQRRAETFAQWRLNDRTTGLFPFQYNVPFVFGIPSHPHFSGRQRERAVLD